MRADRDHRVCIIGAGAAGIAAASTLRDLGYRRVVLLESEERIGGKCWTRVSDGVPLDAGATFVLSHYPTVQGFARRVGVHLDRAVSMQHLGEDGSVRPFGRPPRPYPLDRRMKEFARFGAEMARAIPLLVRPPGEVNPALVRSYALPYHEWVRSRGYDFFHLTAYPLLESWGYGHREHGVPALYTFASVPNYAPRRNMLRMWDITRIPVYQVREGYGEIWRRVAVSMDVRLGTEVLAIERDHSGGVVRTDRGPVEFDRLIIGAAPKHLLERMDASDEEREVFGKQRFLECWQASARVAGLMEGCILDGNLSARRIGHTTGFFRYRRGSDWYYFFGYAEGRTDAEIRANLETDIVELGGQLCGTLDYYVRWPYFPHYGPEELADGYYARQQALQGQRSTFYTGEFTGPMGVEFAASHGVRLASRYFV